METGYIIEYSEFHFFSTTDERERAFCRKNELVKLLQSGKITLWNARWVNSELTDISKYERLDLNKFSRRNVNAEQADYF